jgi:hypothetical protein
MLPEGVGHWRTYGPLGGKGQVEGLSKPRGFYLSTFHFKPPAAPYLRYPISYPLRSRPVPPPPRVGPTPVPDPIRLLSYR